jgi:DNA-binding NtrC family response regulator
MRPTVLVVEDDETLRLLMVEAISLLNVRVVACANADEAVIVLERSVPIALVLTDVTMPGSLDGLELAKMIWVRWPSIPVIITSGKPLGTTISLPSHAIFLTKPCPLDLLLLSVDSCLARPT